MHATTNAGGEFSTPALGLGTYRVEPISKTENGVLDVDLGTGGANVTLPISELRQTGQVAVARSATVRGSCADTTLDATAPTRAPTSDSFPETLIQLPGTARGANGVVHMNGDHGVVDYVIDGVPLPQALDREIGSAIDPNDISFLDAIEGAYPAQYGLRFGWVLDITTRAGTGPLASTEASVTARMAISIGRSASRSARNGRRLRCLAAQSTDEPGSGPRRTRNTGTRSERRGHSASAPRSCGNGGSASDWANARTSGTFAPNAAEELFLAPFLTRLRPARRRPS